MKIVLSILLIGSGIVVLYGSATGRLAPMLAAIFAPEELTSASGSTTSTSTSSSPNPLLLGPSLVGEGINWIKSHV